MVMAWFVIWFICNLIGGDEPLKLDPVNGWTATLILAAGLDINRPRWGAGQRQVAQRAEHRLRLERTGAGAPRDHHHRTGCRGHHT
jgi:hypothetical protein